MTRWARARITAVIAALASVCACVPKTAVNVSGTYQERVAVRPASPSARATCTVEIDQVADTRTDPEVLGVVLGRAVKGPTDTQAWLHSVLGGLNSRAVHVVFSGAGEPALADALHLSVELRTAWVTTTSSNKTANIVLRVQLAAPDAPASERSVRGSQSTINWNASDSELKTLVDEAFGKALDQLADVIRPMCHP